MDPSSEDFGSIHKGKAIKAVSWQKRLLRFSLIFFLVSGVGAGGVCTYWMIDLGIFSLSDGDLETLLSYRHHDNSVVYDRSGEKIGEYYSSHYVFVSYDKMPQDLIDAVVAVEDRNFFNHSGFDFFAIIRAALSHFKSSGLKQGGSTITQQVVRNFLLTRERTIERKLRELVLSYLLEKQISKERILEIYLNALFLGNGAYGVGSASERYFGKSLHELETHELALIAGLFQSPSGYNPHKYPKKAKKRQLSVIRAMMAVKKITRAEAKKIAKKPLKYIPYNKVNFSTAPYFLDYVREEVQEILGTHIKNRGLRIYTSIDSELQKLAQESVDEASSVFALGREQLQSAEARENDQIELAHISIDPKTGEILTMIGGRDYQKSQFNRAVHAKRSPGSAFKPIVYSLALKQGKKWSDMVYVSPIAIDDYRPRNHGNVYLTETTLLKAFYRSINTPLVALGQEIGLEKTIEHAHALGISSEIRKEAGSLLGSSETSLLEMAQVYATFANQGVRTKPVAVLRITDREGKTIWTAPELVDRQEEVISPENAYLITEGLRSVLTHGTAYSYRNLSEIAVGKTGTSNLSKDNWLCGYTSELVSIVWVGTEDPEGFTHEIAANTLALPIWGNFMKKVANLREPALFEIPEGIETEKVSPEFGIIDDNGMDMYFLSGQGPTRTQSSFKTLARSGRYRNIFDR